MTARQEIPGLGQDWNDMRSQRLFGEKKKEKKNYYSLQLLYTLPPKCPSWHGCLRDVSSLKITNNKVL